MEMQRITVKSTFANLVVVQWLNAQKCLENCD